MLLHLTTPAEVCAWLAKLVAMAGQTAGVRLRIAKLSLRRLIASTAAAAAALVADFLEDFDCTDVLGRQSGCKRQPFFVSNIWLLRTQEPDNQV